MEMFFYFIPVIEVDNFVEKEGPASGPCESCRDQLSSVGQEGFAVDAAEEAEPAHVRQVVTTHLEVIFKNLPVWLFPLTDKLLFLPPAVSNYICFLRF